MKKVQRIVSLLMIAAMVFGMSTQAFARDMAKVGQTVTVSTNGETSAYIDENGGLWMSGYNNYGELGNGGVFASKIDSEVYQTTPVKVLDDVISVQVGQNVAYALKKDKTLWGWGDNQFCQLGIDVAGNDTTLWGTPVQTVPVKLMDNVVQFQCDDTSFFCGAVKTDGSLWTWGEPDWAMSGVSARPKKFADNVVAFASGNGQAAIIKKDGSLYMWGAAVCGMLGLGKASLDDMVRTPKKVMDDVVAVSCGDYRTMAIKSDGSLWGWGANTNGQLGNGGATDAVEPYFGEGDYRYAYCSTPQKIMDNVKAVSLSVGAAAVVKTDGSLWMWGENIQKPYNAFGNGMTGGSRVPVKVTNERGFVSVVGGESWRSGVVFAQKDDGSIWGWSNNGSKGVLFEAADNMPIAKIIDNATLPTGIQRKTKSGFSDVLDSAYYADAVIWAVEDGITNGVGDNNFGSNMTVTRGQAMTFLWRAAGKPAPSVDATQFADVKADTYYADAILWAVEQGITNGTGGNNFSPDSPVTRGQMVTFLYRAAGQPDTTNSDTWYEDAVNWATSRDLLSGTAEAFSVNGACPRSDVIEYMYRELAN